MKNIRIIAVITLLIILGLSYYLRNYNYSKIPFPGESMDEYSFTWVGLSLIQLGVPVGISGITGYKSYDYRYINVDQVFKSTAKGNTFAINFPWFDHPPLLGLVTGGYTYFKGGRVFEDAQVVFIRKPMVVIGALSVGLLFIFLLFVFGFKEAFAASLVYATSPLAIIGSRMVQAENLLIPFFLASLTVTYFYLKKQQTWLFWVSVVIAGTALLVKFSAISIILSNIFIILLFYKDGVKKAIGPAITFGIASLSFLLFFVSYGQAYDFRQFLDIFSSNSNRFYGIGSSAFYELLVVTKITGIRYLTDGWVLAGWIAALSLFSISQDNRKKDMFILIPLVCYLSVFILFGSEPYGWYRYPFLPFLFAAAARVLVLSLANINLLIPSFLILLLPVGVDINKILGNDDFQKYTGIWKWGLLGLFILFLILYLNSKSKYAKVAAITIISALFIFSIYLNLEYFWKITPEYWRSST